MSTLHQARDTDEGCRHQRDGSLGSTVDFLPGLRHNESVARVFKFIAIRAPLLYQLIKYFPNAISPLGPGNPGIKLNRVSDSALGAMIY